MHLPLPVHRPQQRCWPVAQLGPFHYLKSFFYHPLGVHVTGGTTSPTIRWPPTCSSPRPPGSPSSTQPALPPLAMRPTHRPTRSSLRAPARCSPHRPMGTTRCSPRHADRGRGRGGAPGRAVRAGVPHWRQDDAHDIPIAHVPAPQVRYRRGRSPVKDGPCVLLLPPGGEVAKTLCFTTSTTST
jgi:hypothetical protein